MTMNGSSLGWRDYKAKFLPIDQKQSRVEKGNREQRKGEKDLPFLFLKEK